LDRFKIYTNPADLITFQYAAEIVINDIIFATYKVAKLPGNPPNGPDEPLIGKSTVGMSTEQVAKLLKQSENYKEFKQFVDDHGMWGEEVTDQLGNEKGELGEGTKKPDQIIKEAQEIAIKNESKLIGNVAGEMARLAKPSRKRKNLDQFVLDILRDNAIDEIKWQRPSRTMMAIYPDIMVPTYEPPENRFKGLMAIDTSGSVPDKMLDAAWNIAKTPINGTKLDIISWDTKVYPIKDYSGRLKGGGGTDANCVEKYIQDSKVDYDIVFCITDGGFGRPKINKPDRWVFLLPDWGWDGAIPKKSKTVKFDVGNRRYAT